MTTDNTAPPPADATWAYRIRKPHSHPQDAALSYGTRGTSRATTADELAYDLVNEVRASHSYYTGPLTVALWTLDDPADETRRPRETGPVPAGARVIEAPASMPAIIPTSSWAYRIEKTGPAYGSDPGRAVMSLGTRQAPFDADTKKIADELAEENRAAHSYYTGRLQVAVWLHNEEADRYPRRDAYPPYDAYHYRYDGDGTEDAPLPDQPDDVDEETRARWNAKTLGPAGRVDPAVDPNFRPLHFVGGPWHGQTKFQARVFWPPQAMFLGENANGDTVTVHAPERDGDDRPRYRPGGSCDRALMIWHDPKGFQPVDLLLSPIGHDPVELAAFDVVVGHARGAHDATPPFGSVDYAFQAAVAEAGRGFVAVALRRLIEFLPDATPDQRRFLDEAAATLALDVVTVEAGTNDDKVEQ
ncbi:hypothetical protein [Streptomyces sp. NPDC049879]|uniref:hypothetical protein n=1 Tax=Streptomyces sp. NPDC049879 TaxID=3365598 RepID=UPI0037B8FDA6